MLIDSHCHLDFDVFTQHPDTFQNELLFAGEAGLTELVVPAVSFEHFDRVRGLPAKALACAQQTSVTIPRVHFALGLHPYFLDAHEPRHIDALALALEDARQKREPLVAVGEIGLDYFLTHLPADKQMTLFKAQLDLAKQFDLPVILHVRKAHDQVLKLLRNVQLQRGGVIHAFSGSEQQAHQYLGLGFKLGFGGAITYARATKLRGILARLPSDAWVLETDAPDMPLAGYAGQPNRPGYVHKVALAVAQLRDESLEQVAKCSSDNARQLFNLLRQVDLNNRLTQQAKDGGAKSPT